MCDRQVASAMQSGTIAASRLARKFLVAFSAVASICAFVPTNVAAQDSDAPPSAATNGQSGDSINGPPVKVDVNPAARDEEIQNRLTRILKATTWFREVDVSVQEGVVFLRGRTTTDNSKEWAGNLGRSVQDVVAVVNQIQGDNPEIWDTSVVEAELTRISRSVLRGVPVLAFSIIILIIAAFLSRFVARSSLSILGKYVQTDLLRQVAAKTSGIALFVIACYLVLQIAGLTRLALTFAGGTGLLGLAIGIAFRDISENFLASLYLSLRKPFEVGDLIEVLDKRGYVQRVTSRTTILMTLEGNHVQIPNATVFKNVLTNFTSNPTRRVDFAMSIDFDTSIVKAQNVAMQILREHPAVLSEPEPWVLVDGLSATRVNLRVYFWLNGNHHSWLKLKSAVIRQIKRAYQQNNISLVEGGSPVVRPVIELLEPDSGQVSEKAFRPSNSKIESADDATSPEPVASSAEGNLTNEADVIRVQAQTARLPEEGENLIADSPPSKA